MYWILIAIVLFFVLLKLCLHLLNTITIGNNKNRYVLVTGCDSGFGYLLTKKLDLLGFHVFAGCLTKSGMERLRSECSSNVISLQLDVTNDENINEVAEFINSKLQPDKGLWAVVNNAGVVGGVGPTSWQTREDYEKTMSVNVYGVVMVTKALLPLINKAKGRIVNTASIMGRFAFINVTYTISKYGVEAFSDVLRREVYGSGVSIHIIEPGFYQTTLLDRASYLRSLEAKIKTLPKDIKESLPVNFTPTMGENFDKFIAKVASPKVHEVVDAYINAITSMFPKKRYLVGFDANYIYYPLSLLPECVSDWVIQKLTP